VVPLAAIGVTAGRRESGGHSRADSTLSSNADVSHGTEEEESDADDGGVDAKP
jgi:hypothetical protein